MSNNRSVTPTLKSNQICWRNSQITLRKNIFFTVATQWRSVFQIKASTPTTTTTTTTTTTP